MFKKNKKKLAKLVTFKSKPSVEAIHGQNEQVSTADDDLEKQISGRFASLIMICYQRKDISGIHIALTAYTHTLHAVGLWGDAATIKDQTRVYILQAGFPMAEIKALDWLLNHYFELPNESDESLLLNWYQSLDDEWVVRKKLREMFPEKKNSELTQYIAAETSSKK